MDGMSRAESMKAAQEARDRVPSPRGSSASAIEAAMRRYLSAEQYHELMEDEPTAEEKAADEPAAAEQGAPDQTG